MSKLKNKIYPLFVGVVLTCFFLYFYRITSLTPLAGDDWGYALNGMKGNPFVTLFEFYQNWSGRLVAELWGLVVAPRKQLWNLMNALLFTVTLFCLLKTGNRKNRWGAVGLVLFLVFTVSEFLRMETYTWIMGTTYVIPLCLSLVYFCLIEANVFDQKKMTCPKLAVTSLLCLIIGITMENIAAMMIAGVVLVLIFCFVVEKKIRVDFSWNLLFSTIGFAIMRLSPGSAFRTERDHAAWIEKSLFEKIEGQLSNFFSYTFIENKFLIFTLASITIGVLIFKGWKWLKNHPYSSLVIFSSQSIAVFFSCANVLAAKLGLTFLESLIDPSSIVVRLWWILYVVLTFFALFVLIENKRDRMKANFYLMMAGGCNLVMLYSPIFGSRSSLYFVFFMMAVVLILYSQICFPFKGFDLLVCAFALTLVFVRGAGWLNKYELVHEIQMIREGEIEYYRTHPEEDAWICRVPPYSVHGADIEDDDTYHQEVFREYFGLDENQKLIFYWKESYD